MEFSQFTNAIQSNLSHVLNPQQDAVSLYPLLPYLQLAWRTEKARVDTLKEAFDVVDDEDLRTFVLDYRDTTLRQVEILEELIRERGGLISTTRVIVNQLLGKIGDGGIVTLPGTDPNLLTAARLFGDTQYEMALYDAIASVAQASGEPELAHTICRLREFETEAVVALLPFLTLDLGPEHDASEPFGFAEAGALFQ